MGSILLTNHKLQTTIRDMNEGIQTMLINHYLDRYMVMKDFSPTLEKLFAEFEDYLKNIYKDTNESN